MVSPLRARQSVCEAETAVAARNPSSWVFPAPSNDAKSMNAAFLRFKVCYKLLRRAEVRQVRIHDLPMFYVKEQLGHSTVQVTVDLDGHIRPGLNRGTDNGLAETTRPGAQAIELTTLRSGDDGRIPRK